MLMHDDKLIKLEQRIGYQFVEKNWLRLALTHRSFAKQHNERLEFLGDSILNFIMAEILFQRYPHYPEGTLSRLRSNLVKGETLTKVAQQLQLGDYLFLGTGEMRSGGFRRKSTLADAVEALLAAIYLDADIITCKHRIEHWFADLIEQVDINSELRDAKSMLQEYLQARHLPLPEYNIINIEGAAHEQIFHVACSLANIDFTGQGQGQGRRKAEQTAAQQMLEWLTGNSNKQ